MIDNEQIREIEDMIKKVIKENGVANINININMDIDKTSPEILSYFLNKFNQQ